MFIITILFLIFSFPVLSQSEQDIKKLKDLYLQGRRYFILRKYNKARLYFQKAYINDYKNGDMFFYLAFIYEKHNDIELAAKFYKLALDNKDTLNPKYLKTAQIQMQYYYKQNNDINSILNIMIEKHAPKKKINHLINYMLKTDNQEALQYMKQYEGNGGVSNLFNAIYLDNNFLAAWSELASVYSKNKMFFSSAYIIGDKVLSEFSAYSIANYKMAENLRRLKYYKRSISYYKQAKKLAINDKLKKIINVKLALVYALSDNLDMLKYYIDLVEFTQYKKIFSALWEAKKQNIDIARDIVRGISSKYVYDVLNLYEQCNIYTLHDILLKKLHSTNTDRYYLHKINYLIYKKDIIQIKKIFKEKRFNNNILKMYYIFFTNIKSREDLLNSVCDSSPIKYLLLYKVTHRVRYMDMAKFLNHKILHNPIFKVNIK